MLIVEHIQLQLYMEQGYAENDCRLSETVFILP